MSRSLGSRPGDEVLVDLPDGQTVGWRIDVLDDGSMQVVPEHEVVTTTAAPGCSIPLSGSACTRAGGREYQIVASLTGGTRNAAELQEMVEGFARTLVEMPRIGRTIPAGGRLRATRPSRARPWPSWSTWGPSKTGTQTSSCGCGSSGAAAHGGNRRINGIDRRSVP
jgi:hypothetical protein